jgi:uncharacterized protein
MKLGLRNVRITLLILIILFPVGLQLSHTAPSQKPNHLIHEKSPYLLQHAYNPVDWYPWGSEAFAKAKKENKLIFLSIGYSTCHWCHVMERESYSDPQVGKLLNDSFVSIKVDREERPDIDQIYMDVSQMLTGTGGWPLNIVMTPDQRPFFAATYIPKESRFGRTGMLELIPKLRTVWETRRDEVLKSANRITGGLQDLNRSEVGAKVGLNTLSAAYEEFEKSFDSVHGGFGEAPKFPSAHELSFLLRYWKRSGNSKALEMVERTLQQMRLGGIFDHIGFGFHRYSTDEQWLVPHFEKMLYDQAMLMMAYTETYQATGKKEYADTAREIATYVLRDMTSAPDGFYSAEDADSEEKEGKFYLWNQDDIKKVLGSQADAVIQLFDIKKDSNFIDSVSRKRGEGNIFHLREQLTEEQKKSWEAARQRLFADREKRVHPAKDDKIMTDWNGLMIAALAKLGRAVNQPQYVQAAGKAADFLLVKMRKPGGSLLHRFRSGDAAIEAHLDDYEFLIYGLTELYESTFNTNYLQSAIDLNQYVLKHFWDTTNGGFYLTSDNAEKLLIRPKEFYDGAIPSGNSVAMLNLLRLARITGNSDLEEKASRLQFAFSAKVSQTPQGFTQFLVAADFAIGPSLEIVVAGKTSAKDTKQMLDLLNHEFVPNKVLLLRPTEEEDPRITHIAAFTKYQQGIGDKATVYVCRNYVCKTPTTDTRKMLEFIHQSK